ncbi:MAG TPA: phosphotransferase [Clostridia bacterium]|nr:phosphotransferase [Clostridia bacterium]
MQRIAEELVNRYFRLSPQKITPLGGGWYGRVFLAEMTVEPTKVIVKIHLVPNLAEKEACQLEVLATHATVKMPKVLFVHKATIEIPNDAILMEYIPGVNAGNHTLLEREEKNRFAIAEQIVDNLLSYHKVINPGGFGELGANCFEPDWKKWYKIKADDALSKAESFYAGGKIDDAIFSVIRKAHELYDRIFYLPVKQARLIHGDYNTWNILLDENLTHVSGVIDPLNSCFADSEMDLYQLNHANGKEYKLLDIYASKFPLSENFPLKSSFYELFEHVAHYYDAHIEIDCPFMAALAKELEQQMQKFGLL